MTMRRSMAEPLFLVFVLFCILLSPVEAKPQRGGAAPGEMLQAGVPVARTMARGQVHTFSVPLRQDDFAQVIVDQKGVDVIVRVISPDGKTVEEFDSPNGAIGPENVSVVAVTAGTYSIQVVPFNQIQDMTAGRY